MALKKALLFCDDNINNTSKSDRTYAKFLGFEEIERQLPVPPPLSDGERQLPVPQPEYDSNGFIFPTYNLFRNRNPLFLFRMYDRWKLFRTYELPYQDYFIVFAPYKRYSPKLTDLARIEKYCRTKFKYERILVTREIMATSIHFNVVITTKYDCYEINKKNINKLDFKACVQILPGIQDQVKAIKYICKEADQREMRYNKDYYTYCKDKRLN